MKLNLSDPTRFLRENTREHLAPLAPEVRLLLADETVPIWKMNDDALLDAGLPPPFWAFAWAGGQALARFVLDHPEYVAGKHVLDFACGCGISAIAAMKAGAASVLASDIDPLACTVTEMSAALNDVSLTTTPENLVGKMGLDVDVILAGDVCYEQPLSDEVQAWLAAYAARGVAVLIGDPGRTYLPKPRLTALATYNVETTRELEDNDVRRTTVWKLNPAA